MGADHIFGPEFRSHGQALSGKVYCTKDVARLTQGNFVASTHPHWCEQAKRSSHVKR